MYVYSTRQTPYALFNYKYILVLAVLNSRINLKSSLNSITCRNQRLKASSDHWETYRTEKMDTFCIVKLKISLCLSNILNNNFENINHPDAKINFLQVLT